MTDARRINLHIDYDQLAALFTATGECELYRALGRLTTWGLSGYPVVDIHDSSERDGPGLVATYRRTLDSDDVGFVLAAVWNRGTPDDPGAPGGYFSFHS